MHVQQGSTCRRRRCAADQVGQIAQIPQLYAGLLFRAGIISDIQYADIPDGKSFGGVPRYYRSTMQGLQRQARLVPFLVRLFSCACCIANYQQVYGRAVAAWRQQKVDCAVHFGDVLDGFHPKAQSLSALRTIAAEFDVVGKPHYHMIGNHCLYNLPRQVPMMPHTM